MRGKANFDAPKFGASADVELAVLASGFARLEFIGPLGIRVALLQINRDWVYLFVPREKSVIRFPTAELSKDTIRRERFLSLLPIPVVPEAFFLGLLSQVGGLEETLKNPKNIVACDIDPESRSYVLRIPGTSVDPNGGRFVWVDGVDYYPIKIAYFERSLPKTWNEKTTRPSFQIDYSNFSGLGTSTLPRHFQLMVQNEKVLDFEWDSAELWENPDMTVFDWRPSASMTVRDY